MQTGPYSTYSTAAQITPSDTVNQSYRGIFIGGAGTVTVTTAGGNTVQFTCPAGIVLPVEVTRVWASATTATLMVGLA